jgi:hypothetical protein
LAAWSLSPLLAWGLFQRGIGLVLLITFTSLCVQVVPAVGSNSILPIAKRLAKLREDFPTWKRFLYFPTLLWLSPKDWVLRALTFTGLFAAAFVVYGGPFSGWALATCYVCYLSLDLAVALILPWDTLLFELMVLSLFLPHTQALPSLEAAAAPAPALAWAFRLLFFRVLFGFGKQKFLGSRPKDLAYLKGYLLNQPLLSPGGWYMQKLPVWMLRGGVLFMFFVEIPAPFFAFFPGPLSVIAGASTILLMLGIQATGNFGYFSVLTIVASIPLFDSETPRALELLSMFDAGQPRLVNAFVVVHTLAALITFPFNSWLAQGWHLWAFWYQLPRWAQLPLDFMRFFHPLRWVHPYGVFPPNNTPAVKITVLLEVTWDNKQWHEVMFKYAPSNPKSAPHFVAPHHPRGEQAIIYDTFGMNYTSLLSTAIPAWDPSGFCTKSPGVVFCQSVLRGGARRLFKGTELEHRTEPLLAARVTTVMLEPVSLQQRRATGDWWKRTYIGPHVPAQEVDPDFQSDVIGEPELWHFDAIFWRRRSRLKKLLDRALSSKDDPMQLVRLDWPELTDRDIERFWSETVPLVGSPRRESFDTVPTAVKEIERLFNRKERRIQHRLLGRFALILVARLEPLYHHRGLKPLIPVRTNFHLWMLVHHVIGCGKHAYLAALADPPSVAAHAPAMTNQTGLYALAVFRFEEMTFDAQKLRLLETYFYPHDQQKKRELHQRLKNDDDSTLKPLERKLVRLARAAFGLFSVLPHVREAFRGPAFERGYPELYPTFVELDSGEIVVAEYKHAAADTELAPDLKSVPR